MNSSDAVQFLTALRGGEFMIELAEALADVGSAVSDTGKEGSIALTLKIAPVAGETFQITDNIIAKKPVRAAEKTVLYRDAETGTFMRRDPRQPELPLRSVARQEAAANG